MEHTIGDLGRELRQPGNPFANLSRRAVLRVQVNNLKSLVPDIEKTKPRLPRGALHLKDGFSLLRARDEYACRVSR